MISINPPFQVLVTSGNQALLVKAKRPYELKVGQLGVFDYETGLSVDGTETVKPKSIFMAVGLGAGAAGSAAADIRKSTGERIDKKAVRALTVKPYAPAVNQIETLTFGQIVPEKEYNVKFEIRNQEAYANYGYNLPSKNFAMVGGPEVDPDTGLASSLDFATRLAAYINSDDEKFMVATVVAGGTDDTASITVEFKALDTHTFGNGVNLNYFKLRGTYAVTSMVDFGVDSTSATTQKVVYTETSGYDLADDEYVAGGWNEGGIYRNSDITGFTGAIGQAVPTVGYDTTSITYDNIGIGGGDTYGSSLLTIVAVPSPDDATATALDTLLKAVLPLA